MATHHTYTVDGFKFDVLTGFEPGGQILLSPDAPIYSLKWRAAFKVLVKDFPLMVFLQELYYDMNRDLSDERYYCEYHIQNSLPKAQELAKTFPIPNDVWLFFATCANILNNPIPNPKKKDVPVPGYVYLLQADSGHFKIGRSKNPKSRIKTFGVQLPFEVEYIAVIPSGNMNQLETELHAKYQDKRVNGEWFDLSSEDVEYIKGLAS